MIKSKTTNLGIMEAVKELKEISFTDRLRYEYELRLKAKRDREAEMDYAYEQGQEAGRETEREENLKILISTLREYGHTDEQIIKSLMEKYGISREAAEEKLKQQVRKDLPPC